uniref:Si:dkey-109j17.5 n=1 Tax=Lepisosteus oculatus TaxID=7918 RepID=W5NB31_LEPOC|nr:PREDICTED: zinc finger BED domain-containing protein DAYSLEEPER-like [Lepisosteus oculatus]
MASHSRVSILDYFNIVFEGENGKIESNCKACGTRIQAKRTVTSNFVTHLKRKHQAMYDEFVKKKDIKREAYSSGGVHLAPSGRAEPPARPSHSHSHSHTHSLSLSLGTGGGGGGGVAKFERGDPRQAIISEAIAKMIIRDLQPVRIVESEGFRELLRLLEPRYTPESRKYVQQQLLPGYAYQAQLASKQALQAAESCSVTLDVWRSGPASGYLGVTCHFITSDWQIKSALLACLRLSGPRTAERILPEYDEISRAHGIAGKVFRVVADGGSDSRASFRLPGFCLQSGDEEEEEDEDEDEEGSGDEEGGGEGLCLGPRRVACFARSLARCVRDGLRASPPLALALTKAACFLNYVRATVAPEKLQPALGRAPAGERRWNAQLKAVRRLLEAADFLEDVAGRRDLALGAFEKAALRELVELLEPFEEATDMVEGDKHVPVSLALPCVLGLRKHLAESAPRQCAGLLGSLAQALDRRLARLLEDPLHVTATALDPQFKLSWSSSREQHRQVVLEEVSQHGPSPPPSQAPRPPPCKRSKLFSFMRPRPAAPARSLEQELAAYLHEDPTDEDPLHYWRRKAADFPQLAHVAKRVFTVPATSTPVERIFGTVGRIARPERCQLLPRNLETLIYLKANYRLLWT